MSIPWIDLSCEVLASSRGELAAIERAFQTAHPELVEWVAAEWGEDLDATAAKVTEIVRLTPVSDLPFAGSFSARMRRFRCSFENGRWGVMRDQLSRVSGDFPNAIFLLKCSDSGGFLSTQSVLKAGKTVKHSRDEGKPSQGREWAPIDIFHPYRNEFFLGEAFGSLWNAWVEQMDLNWAELKGAGSGALSDWG